MRPRPPGSTRTTRSFPTRRASDLTPGENALLRVQTVLGLVPHHRLRPVDDRGGHLVAAVRRQAVHEDRLRLGQRHNQVVNLVGAQRSEEHTSELQSLMRISYAVFCSKKKNNTRLQMAHRTE